MEKLKNTLIALLQRLIGYERYLFLFARLKIRFLHKDSRKREFLFFSEMLNDDATVIVIGASIGITTIPLVKENRHVIAYEPLPSNYNVLNKVVSHFKALNVDTYNVALGEQKNELEMILSYNVALGEQKNELEMILPVIGGAKKHGMSHLKADHISGFEKGIPVTVIVDRLDDRPEVAGLRIDAMKIVAENYEYQILRGAEELIRQHKPTIYCELWHNDQRDVVLQLIKKYDYEIFFLNSDNQLIAYDEASYHGKNFFFKHKQP